MFERSESFLKQLQNKCNRLERLKKKYKKFAAICTANICGRCNAMKDDGTLDLICTSLKAENVPFDIFECGDDAENYAMLESAGTTRVPCVIFIENGSSRIFTIDDFLKDKRS